MFFLISPTSSSSPFLRLSQQTPLSYIVQYARTPLPHLTSTVLFGSPWIGVVHMHWGIQELRRETILHWRRSCRLQKIQVNFFQSYSSTLETVSRFQVLKISYKYLVMSQPFRTIYFNLNNFSLPFISGLNPVLHRICQLNCTIIYTFCLNISMGKPY